ncbi:hypothetical protein DIURU_004202 [Diutina rugosa]|uniref:SAM-dependent MTase RsmB/NOP-type domain-containing protein n=1 Tax=Diutina rugosa TaxID=5481 RepID=A0A642UIE5_DIURU|nr:uncharacterized protein DIURU_004202 [Diutina rugosa]KAA8899535.1 hypothetical protein DIURU_004202 [Diutina rugosa]
MKLYFEAEKFIKGGLSGLQSRVFQAKLSSSPKHVYALVINTLKLKPYIEEVIKKSGIQKDIKRKCSASLLLLLVYDLAFSPQGRIQSGKHPLKDEVLRHKTRLAAEVTRLKIKHKVKSLTELATEENDDETPVRWIRVNTLKATPDDVFNTAEFKKLESVSRWQDIKAPGYIYTDDYIENLYGVHPRERITESEAYKNGHIIIQDRASCFPAHLLCQADTHDEIIDATAAPGNKTTHVAALSRTLVYAFERDDNRVKTLKMMCQRATDNKDAIHVTHADFTATKPEDFPNVTGLIVDPSCSGSGIFGRGSNNQEQTHDEGRLAKLAAFQFKIVKHAMSFPKARRVIYSTCSVHAEENEQVVAELLNDRELWESGWRLEKRDNVLSTWPHRGLADELKGVHGCDADELAGGCVRATPKEDGGIGFFAASFVNVTRKP